MFLFENTDHYLNFPSQPPHWLPGVKPVGSVEIDWTHSLTVGLVGSITPQGNLVDRTAFELRQSTLSPTIAGLGLTDGARTSNGEAGRAAAPSIMKIKNAWTIFFVGDYWGREGEAFSIDINSVSYRGTQIQVIPSSASGGWEAQLTISGYFDGSTSDTSDTGPTGPITQGFHSYIITRDGATVSFYEADSGINTTDVDTGFNTSDYSSPSNPLIQMGRYGEGNIGSGSLTSNAGYTTLALIWNRVLSEAERVSISADPCQFLKPA